MNLTFNFGERTGDAISSRKNAHYRATPNSVGTTALGAATITMALASALMICSATAVDTTQRLQEWIAGMMRIEPYLALWTNPLSVRILCSASVVSALKEPLSTSQHK